jgi:hypothetical protein
MRLYSPASHTELTSDFVVVATLEKQLYDLLFTLTQTDGLFAHQDPLICGFGVIRIRSAARTTLTPRAQKTGNSLTAI